MDMGIGIFLCPGLADTKDFFRIVLPYLVVRDNRNTDSLEHGLLIPGLTHAVAINGAGFHGGRHLWWRRHREQGIGLDRAADIALGRRIITGVDAT